MGVFVNGEEEATVERNGEDCGVVNSCLAGQVVGEQGKEYPPSSIEGELEILSIMSSSMSSSTSASCMSPSSPSLDVPPFSLTACSSCCEPLFPLMTVRSSSEPGSSRSVLPASLHASCRRASSEVRSCSTCRIAACW